MLQKNPTIVLAVVILLELVSLPSQAEKNHSVTGILASAYRDMDVAATHRDVNKVLSYNDADYTVRMTNGRIFNLVQQKQAAQLMLSTAQKASSITHIEHIKVFGQTAIVQVKRRLDFTMALFDSGTGKYDHYTNVTLTQDRWGCSDHKWTRRSSQVLFYKAIRNGQVIPQKH